MAARWRVLHTKIALSVDNTAIITIACCCLHNFLMKTERKYAKRRYCPTNFADRERDDGEVEEGYWRKDKRLISVSRQNGYNRATNTAKDTREIFKDYFLHEGSVSWQTKVIN